MKQVLSGILQIITRDEKAKFGLLIAADLFIGLLDIAFLGALLLVIGFYTKGIDPAYLRYLPASLADRNSVWLIGIFLLLFALKNYLGYAATHFQHHFFYDVATRLSGRNIREYFNGSYQQYVGVNSASYIRHISQQPIEFSHYVLNNVQQIISQLILIVFAVAAILLYHPTLFLLLLVLLLPPVVVLGWFIKQRSGRLRGQTKVAAELAIRHLNESLAGYVEGNIYSKKDFFVDRYYQYQRQLNDTMAAQNTVQSLPPRLVEVFAVLGFFILIVINKFSANAPAVDILTIGIFMAAAYKIIPGIVKILNSQSQIRAYSFTLTDLLPKDNKPPVSVVQTDSQLRSVRFSNVCFHYKDHPVLNNINFKLRAGELVGLSAPSGRGKTTMINLLLGFLEPCAGNIIVNDKPTTATSRQGLWQSVAYAKQQPYFIHDTIAKNITLSEDGPDSDRLDNALQLSGLSIMMDKFPGGIDFMVNEDGRNISGGQRQRIALARALYRDADLLILDEPFSELDEKSANGILKKLKSVADSGKIVLLISHQHSHLAYCNQVISIND